MKGMGEWGLIYRTRNSNVRARSGKFGILNFQIVIFEIEKQYK